MINLCVQNSHKFAQNEPHMGVCDILCKFENVMFWKENWTHKSHKFAESEHNDHVYSLPPSLYGPRQTSSYSKRTGV